MVHVGDWHHIGTPVGLTKAKNILVVLRPTMFSVHRIWTIQPGTSFLEAFADGLMALYPKDGLDLEDIFDFSTNPRVSKPGNAFLKLNGGQGFT